MANKVVYISENIGKLNKGGVSQSGLDFLHMLSVKYNDITVISSDKVIQLNDSYLGEPISAIKKWYRLKPNVKLGKLSLRNILVFCYNKLKFLEFKGQLDLYFQETDHVVVYVNSMTTIFDFVTFNGMSSIKKVCVLRGCPDSFKVQSEYQDDRDLNMAISKLENYDTIINVSSICGDEWKTLIKKPYNSYYLPNSINENSISNIKADPGKSPYDDNYFNVVITASIQTRKGQDRIVNNFKKILKKCPNIRFHFLGIVSKRYGGLDIIKNAQALEENLERLIFYGHVDNPLFYVYHADMTMLTSRAEAFPRSIAEYMAMNKIILTTGVSGIPEMINHNLNGLIFDDDNEMITLLKNIYDDKDSFASLGDNAVKSYFEKFSKHNQLKTSQAIFNQI